MGGDNHFLVRNSLTGLILVAFALCGLWIVDETTAKTVVHYISGNWQIVPAIVAAPVLGILIQGICMAVLYFMRQHAFTDPARKVVGDCVRQAAKNISENNPCELAEILRNHFLNSEKTPTLRTKIFPTMQSRIVPDDSAFVWLYYIDAPQHLIEWARRRRDYNYLGMNWAIAAGLGLAIGLSSSSLLLLPKPAKVGLFVLFTACWIGGTLGLAARMKHDADAMELMWACARLEPRMKEMINTAVCTQAVVSQALVLKKETVQSSTPSSHS